MYIPIEQLNIKDIENDDHDFMCELANDHADELAPAEDNNPIQD